MGSTWKTPPEVISVNQSGPGIRYDNVGGEIERDSSDPFALTFARTSYPLSLSRGQFFVDFENMFDLSGPYDIDFENKIGIGRNYTPQNFTHDGSFFDVWVSISDGNASPGNAGDVLVYQNTYDGVQWNTEDVEYYNNSGAGGIGPDPASDFKLLTAPMNIINKPTGHTGTYDAIKFSMQNEQITIFIGDITTDAWETLATSHFVKPVAFSNVALYPKVYIPDGRKCEIQTKGSVTDYFSTYATRKDENWPTIPHELKGKIFLADKQAHQNRKSGTFVYTSRGLSPSAPSEQQHIPYNCVLITSYVDPLKFYEVDDANVGNVLGYAPITSKAVTPASASAKCTFTPTNTTDPELNSLRGDNIAFVRCKTLTQKSLNGDMSGISSIICDIPRYIASSTYGRLFYTPPSKTYLKLQNKSPVVLSRLEIEVVNSNEKLVPDLSDETIVLLHIRKSSN